MNKKTVIIFSISLLIGLTLIGIGIYIETDYTFSSDFYTTLLQNLGIAICIPIIIGFIFENFMQKNLTEQILEFINQKLNILLERNKTFSDYGFESIEIGPKERKLRMQMIQDIENASRVTFVFLRAGLILRRILPHLKKVLDNGGEVNLIYHNSNSSYVKGIVKGFEKYSNKGTQQFPRMNLEKEIESRDREIESDYIEYHKNPKLNIRETEIFLPYGCLMLEFNKELTNKSAYWFPFMVSKTAGFCPVFKITAGQTLELIKDDLDMFLTYSKKKEFSKFKQDQNQ